MQRYESYRKHALYVRDLRHHTVIMEQLVVTHAELSSVEEQGGHIAVWMVRAPAMLTGATGGAANGAGLIDV